MKPTYLTVQQIHQRTGTDPVAKAVGVSQRAVYQWGESPDESGKISPIKRFHDWAEFVTSQHDPEVNAAVLELLKPILDNLGLTVLREDTLADLRRILSQVSPQDRRLDEATPMCPACDSPLRWVPEAGGWYCANCKGR